MRSLVAAQGQRQCDVERVANRKRLFTNRTKTHSVRTIDDKGFERSLIADALGVGSSNVHGIALDRPLFYRLLHSPPDVQGSRLWNP